MGEAGEIMNGIVWEVIKTVLLYVALPMLVIGIILSLFRVRGKLILLILCLVGIGCLIYLGNNGFDAFVDRIQQSVSK